MGRDRSARSHRLRRRWARRRARAVPVGLPQDAVRRPEARHLDAPAGQGRSAVLPRRHRMGGPAPHPRKPCRRRSGAHFHRRAPPLVLVPAQQQPGQCHRPVHPGASWHAVLRAPRERVHLGRRTRHTASRRSRGAGRSRADPDHRPRGRPPADLPRRLPLGRQQGPAVLPDRQRRSPLLAGHLLAPHLGVALDPDDFTLAA